MNDFFLLRRMPAIRYHRRSTETSSIFVNRIEQFPEIDITAFPYQGRKKINEPRSGRQDTFPLSTLSPFAPSQARRRFSTTVTAPNDPASIFDGKLGRIAGLRDFFATIAIDAWINRNCFLHHSRPR